MQKLEKNMLSNLILTSLNASLLRKTIRTFHTVNSDAKKINKTLPDIVTMCCLKEVKKSFTNHGDAQSCHLFILISGVSRSSFIQIIDFVD